MNKTEARQAAHNDFDLLWKSERMTRTQAYNWLAKRMRKPAQNCHIAAFGKRECEHVRMHVRKYCDVHNITIAQLSEESCRVLFG